MTLLSLALAALLNHPATASATWTATVALETNIAARADRREKAEQLGAWLSQLDGERIRAAAVWSPFADEAVDAAEPFEGGAVATRIERAKW